ncbi:ABC transporter permease [Micromonospora sp. NBC_01655]|uniref:ABC transporter permease n=1 Tax=Micromonospora sp. NBC_01655 TaxID=2975983 RepID=UPI00225A5836|nr:ABC transporter permease [Micromonospora sp. NBC_01655]MCX4472460.1 ABC transporter permease [Micromonospora sp. NBC_01655]
MTTFAAVRLVAAREIRVKLRDKTFLISTLFFLLFAAGSAILPALLAGGPTTVAVSTAADADALRQAGLDVRPVADDATAERLVRDGDVDAAVVAGPRVLALDERPDDVVRALSTEPPVRLLDPDALDPLAAFLVPFAFAMTFFFTSQLFGVQIAQSVTEEKQTRIVEILVAAVPVRALLAGKVIAGGVLALGQIALIVAVAVTGMRIAAGGGGILPLLGPALGWFVPFFVIGFVMLAALWAVAGALASRQEDIAGVSMPVQLAVMLPFFAVLFLNDNPLAMRILSYVPFSAPTAMPLRLFTGDAAGWEPVLSLLVLLAATAGCLAVGARLYEGALLRTNGRVTLRRAWRDREPIG